MKTIALLTTHLAVLFAASAAFAASDFAGCPPVLETRQKVVGDYPGWTATDTTGTHIFVGINVYFHHPDQNMRLKPAQIELGDGTLYDYWELDNEEYWMSCFYQGSALNIGKLIPKSKTICFEKYDRDSLEFATCR